MKIARIASVLAALALTVPAAARADHHNEPPKPAPELDKHMKALEGSWKCDGKMEAGAMGPGSPAMDYKSSIKFKKTHGGFWYAGDYEIKKSKAMPGMKVMFHVGWDPTANRLTGLGVDTTGGWRTDHSNGWEGDKMVVEFEGVMMGQKMTGRETITKKGDKAFETVVEMKMGADFKKVGTDSCKR